MGSRAGRYDAGVEQYATRQYTSPSSGAGYRPEYPNPTYYDQRGPQIAQNYPYTPVQTAQYATAPGKSAMAGTVYHTDTTRRPASRVRKWLLYGVAISLVIVAIVVLCVYFAVIKPKNSANDRASNAGQDPSSTRTSSPSPSPSHNPGKPVSGAHPITGGDGSTVTMEDGSTFVYRNSFGGFWIDDPNDPFNNAARPQSWSPALNERFRYGIDQIRGVNLGGWLNIEPFMTPALYEKYAANTQPGPPLDEWMLSFAMRADPAGGGINQIENHYKTFVTEKDFAEIAAAGLNYVRIPLGWWAIETWEGEPFLEGVSWGYFLKAIRWARKYGLRINLDLHAVPGSQNGWNHSGRLGQVGWLNGPMGYANAQRSLDYIRILAQFISQPQYKDVVTMFGILNEPRAAAVSLEALQSFYAEAYRIVRNAGGVGEGNGPWISIHDGFVDRERWAGFMAGADRIALDGHPYRSFGPQSDQPMITQTRSSCEWGIGVNNSNNAFGLTTAGEFSSAVTDCGLYLNGIGGGSRFEGTFIGGGFSRIGSCEPWTDWPNFSAEMKQGMLEYTLASMDALQNYFFWNWKIAPSSVTGKVETPAWSYQLGLEHGWIPKDPRAAVGFCKDNSVPANPLPAWHTGGVGAGQLSSTIPWPPAQITNAGPIAGLPSYTPTGPIVPLAAPTYTIVSGGKTTTADAGSGWANTADRTGMAVPIPTCTYLDPWVDPATPPPPVCGGAAPAGAPVR